MKGGNICVLGPLRGRGEGLLHGTTVQVPLVHGGGMCQASPVQVPVVQGVPVLS